MKKFLTILPTLFASLFYPISKADAISITLDNAYVNSYALASGQGPFVTGTSENKTLELGAATTSATNISPWTYHKYANYNRIVESD